MSEIDRVKRARGPRMDGGLTSVWSDGNLASTIWEQEQLKSNGNRVSLVLHFTAKYEMLRCIALLRLLRVLPWRFIVVISFYS
jgi:hypothetical protein